MRPADAYRQKHRVVDREEGAPLQSLPQREEGSSLQRLDASAAAFDPVRGERQFSVLSKNALSTLDGLVGEVDKLENLLVDLEKMVGAPDDADRLAALGSVRQIVGDLDKLQATRVDAVSTAELNSGKSVARAERKNINRRIDELRPRAKRSTTRCLPRGSARKSDEEGPSLHVTVLVMSGRPCPRLGGDRTSAAGARFS